MIETINQIASERNQIQEYAGHIVALCKSSANSCARHCAIVAIGICIHIYNIIHFSILFYQKGLELISYVKKGNRGQTITCTYIFIYRTINLIYIKSLIMRSNDVCTRSLVYTLKYNSVEQILDGQIILLAKLINFNKFAHYLRIVRVYLCMCVYMYIVSDIPQNLSEPIEPDSMPAEWCSQTGRRQEDQFVFIDPLFLFSVLHSLFPFPPSCLSRPLPYPDDFLVLPLNRCVSFTVELLRAKLVNSSVTIRPGWMNPSSSIVVDCATEMVNY